MPTRRGTECIAAERRLGGIEEIPRVQRAVANELEDVAMKAVRSPPRRRTDHSARGPAHLRRIVAGQDGALLHRIHSKVYAQRASGRAVGTVVYTYAVKTRVILSRPSTRDRHFPSA